MDYKVYIIKSKEDYMYIGFSNNLYRRLHEHNTGQSKATRKGTVWKVVYSESCSTRLMARKREKYFKSHAGKEWLERRGYI